VKKKKNAGDPIYSSVSPLLFQRLLKGRAGLALNCLEQFNYTSSSSILIQRIQDKGGRREGRPATDAMCLYCFVGFVVGDGKKQEMIFFGQKRSF
jgi:hypothetical protein